MQGRGPAARPGPGSWGGRAFLRRAVRYLADEAGIRQFLDIGTGLPTAGNTHEVAQSVAPESRVVYVDNDPVVLSHARALLTSAPRGVTSYVGADARDTGMIIAEAARRSTSGGRSRHHDGPAELHRRHATSARWCPC